MDQQTRSSDEKMWASIAHASILINIFAPGIGSIGAMAIWLFKRRSSSYVAYQTLQAFIFQAAVVFLAVVIGSVVSGLMPLIIVTASVYALYGAYRSYQGLDFRYLWIGNLVASFRPRQ